jgi:hypothetical protein
MLKNINFWLAVFVAPIFSTAFVGISTYYFSSYGLVLFVLLPILIGFVSSFLFNRTFDEGVGKSILVSLMSFGIIGFSILLFAFEGIICLIMVLPLAIPLDILGVFIGWSLAKSVYTSKLKNISVFLLVLTFPFLVAFETNTKSEPKIHTVVSTVIIDAPIETIWQNVVAFPQIDRKADGILKYGFAYPINARIDGEGVGAIRYCNFNTGAFVEPITIWNKPNLLAFDVKEQPEPMTETSFYNDLHVPHLKYILSKKGQFRLFEQDGKVVLEGTTFYTHEISPDFYWKLWSDEIIHQIHLRVLNHIKKVSEK